MQYRTMPKTGDRLSILGFGCMRLPVTKGGSIDEPRAIAQIRTAIDRGVNYLDTAWPYHGGESEPLLGRALADGYRERVRVATKLPSWLIGRREAMDRYLNDQLERLKTDRIDYYLLHTLNGPLWDTLEPLGVADFLDRAIADGRIGSAGFSFHGTADDFKRIVDAYPWTFCQIQYNFLDEDYQAGTAGLKYAAARDLGVVVMEPLRGGNLGVAAPPAVADIWAEGPVPRSPVDWALSWLWHQPEVTVVLSGMNAEAHIEENLAIAERARPGMLSAGELSMVARAGAKYRELMKVGCTGCGYCLPCPSDVMIPICFEMYNKMHMFGDEQTVRLSYALRMSGGLTSGVAGFAAQCVQCGECLEKCPQSIPIPDVLADVVETMEGADLEARLDLARQIFMESDD